MKTGVNRDPYYQADFQNPSFVFIFVTSRPLLTAKISPIMLNNQSIVDFLYYMVKMSTWDRYRADRNPVGPI